MNPALTDGVRVMIPVFEVFGWLVIGVGLASIGVELIRAARTLLFTLVSRRPEDQ